MSARRRSSPRRSGRGFTLVELLVAIGLTGVVAVGLYSLSMVSSQTFQTQQRISEMQMRLRAAMEWVRSDVQRAGYLSTPNVVVDPMVCPRPTAIPLQTVMLQQDVRPTIWPTQNSFLTPVRMTLFGNYGSTDEYPIQGVVGNTVYLQNHTPAFVRVTDNTTMSRIFLNNVVRLRGNDGRMQFGVVTGVNYATPYAEGALPSLTLSSAPVIAGAAVGMGTAGCGLTGFATGATVAPITAVQYRIQDVTTALPGTVSNAAIYNAAKTDLVREEFRVSGSGLTAIAGSLRSVMEYAVDFNVATTFDTADVTAAEPVMTRFNFGDSNNFDWLSDVTASALSRPQRLRAMNFRLATRDRAEDNDFVWVARSVVSDPLTRFKVMPTTTGAARVRSLFSEVQLTNVAFRVFR